MVNNNYVVDYIYIYFNAVFIIDTGKKCFVWIGSDASTAEKKNAMTYATVNSLVHTHCVMCFLLQKYLKGTKHFTVPVTCLKEGDKNEEFQALMG